MTMLQVRGVSAFHGSFQALFGVDLEVDQGECVALIGANGAGKTTLLRAIATGRTMAGGAVLFDGVDLHARSAQQRARAGIALVPEGRRLFPSLTVEENLLLGATTARSGRWDLPAIYQLFPVLATRRQSPATRLSGGQQQMVAIGRALMSNPRLLLCDEVSLGLAPAVIAQIHECLRDLVKQGLAVILVEQDIGRALSASARFFCLRGGRVVLGGVSAGASLEQIAAAYFGTAAA